MDFVTNGDAAEADPAAAVDTARPDRRAELQAAVDALEGIRLPAAPVTPVYRLGMFLVAFAMLLLPLVYFGLVGAVAYLVYRLPTDPPKWAQDEFGGVGGVAIVGTIVGAIFVVFMIKPIFARSEKAPKLYRLKPGEAPELEEFVHRVADAVGAPRPREIELNCEVNAAAGFRRGLWSLFGRDLKLIVGLPLMAGMSVRSFGSVLAHEFGHFSQGAGMRLTYIIRVINAWFVRLVYQRDRLDAWLDGLARTIDLRIAAILWLAKLLIWISRRVLWLLMYLGHGISCFALRQMEFDADRYEVAFAGSDQFAPTSRRLQLLNFGAGRGVELLQETWQQGRISRNYPELVRRQTERLPDEVETTLDEALAEQKTGLFDTHPCDAERISAAENAALPGVFRSDAPASALTGEFDELCRRVTLDFYAEQGLEVKEHNLLANDIIGAEDEMMEREIKAIDRFFGGKLSPERPVFFSSDEVRAAAGDRERAIELCAHGRQLGESLQVKFAGFGERLEKRGNLRIAESLQAAGFKLKPEQVGLSAAELAKMNQTLRQVEDSMTRDRDETFAEFDRMGTKALTEALALKRRLHGPPPEGDGNGEDIVEMNRWVSWMDFFRKVFPSLLELQKLAMQQGVLIHNVGEDGVQDQHLRQMNLLRGRQEKLIGFFQPQLAARVYPFGHADGEVSVWEFIDPGPPAEADAIVRKQIVADAIASQLLRLYQRALGQLAILGEGGLGDSETAAGVETRSDESCGEVACADEESDGDGGRPDSGN